MHRGQQTGTRGSRGKIGKLVPGAPSLSCLGGIHPSGDSETGLIFGPRVKTPGLGTRRADCVGGIQNQQVT